MTFTESQLRDFAQEHVRYEVVTLYSEVQTLAALRGPRSYAYVALVEAPLVHVRLLHEFLGKEPTHKDVSASHYRPGRTLTPVLSDDEYNLVSRQVAHLSMLRANPEWDFGELVTRVRTAFDAFLNELDTDPSESVRGRREYFRWSDDAAILARVQRIPAVVHASTN